MGWSHGGCTVMRIVDRQSRPKDSQPFQVAIAFYPYCDYLYELDTPLLILCGEKDDDLPSSLCLKLDELGPTKKSLYEINLKIYPNAYHCFDFEGLSKDELGHHYEYNPEAAADAIIQTRDFLAKYFKTKM
jgi:dienelactone hydrolase